MLFSSICVHYTHRVLTFWKITYPHVGVVSCLCLTLLSCFLGPFWKSFHDRTFICNNLKKKGTMFRWVDIMCEYHVQSEFDICQYVLHHFLCAGALWELAFGWFAIPWIVAKSVNWPCFFSWRQPFWLKKKRKKIQCCWLTLYPFSSFFGYKEV